MHKIPKGLMSKIAEGVTCFIFNEFILMGDIY